MRALVVLALWLGLLALSVQAGHYTDEWAIEVEGGEAEARKVADETDCDFVGEYELL